MICQLVVLLTLVPLHPSEHETAILADLVTNGGSFVDYRGSDGADWVSVFGKTNADFPAPNGATILADDDTMSRLPRCGTNYPSIHGLQTTKTGAYVQKLEAIIWW